LRFLALIGASGSGKSSLALAGLNPSVQRGELPESETWPLVRCRPGARPWENLQIALSTNPQIALHMAALPALIIHPEDEQRRLHLTAQLALHNQSETHRLFILIDQFEETFTLCKNEADRAKFFDNILYATNVAGGRTIVMLTMRADFYAQCAAYQGLRAAVSDHQSLIGPLSEQELREVIERPAQLAGGDLESGLMELLLADMEGRPGALPFLEHALEKLWELRDGRRLLAKTYTEMGRLEGALDAHAEKFYTETLTMDDQPLCRQIMVDLVRPGEGSADTKKRVPIGELAPTHLKREVLRKLTDARLVTTDGEIEATAGQAELAHEALIGGWKRLGGWVNENREFLLWRQRLSGLLAVWKKEQESGEALLRGPFLIEAQKWFDQRSQDLSDPERKFISASREERERLAREDKERQEHQLKIARELAEAQRERAEEAETNRWLQKERAEDAEKRAKEQKEAAQADAAAAKSFRRLAGILAAVALIAVGGAIFGFSQKQNAEVANAEAKRQETIAKENASKEKIARDAAEKQTRFANEQRLKAEEETRIAESAAADARKENARAESEAAKAKATYERNGELNRKNQEQLNDASMSAMAVAVQRLEDDGRWSEGIAHLAHAVQLKPTNREASVRLYWSLLLGAEENAHFLRSVLTHAGPVTEARFSPDGKLIVSISGPEIYLWEAGKQLAQLEHSSAVSGMNFNSDGTKLVTWTAKEYQVWAIPTGKLLAKNTEPFGSKDDVRSLENVVFSTDGKSLLTSSGSGDVRHLSLWDIPSGKPSTWENDAFSGFDAQFSKDGSKILITWKSVTELWDIPGNRLLAQARFGTGVEHFVRNAQFGEDEQSVFTTDGTQVKFLATTKAKVTPPAWAKGGRLRYAEVNGDVALVTVHTSDDGDVTSLVETASGKEISEISERIDFNAGVDRSEFTGDSSRLLITNEAGGARVVETIKEGREICRFNLGWPAKRSWNKNGTRLVTIDDKGGMQLWDTTRGRLLGQTFAVEGRIFSAEFNPDGKSVLTAGEDGTARVWDAQTGRPTGFRLAVASSAAISPDGTKLVMTRPGGGWGIFDAISRQKNTGYAGRSGKPH
jgi:WD40 repeat protein